MELIYSIMLTHFKRKYLVDLGWKYLEKTGKFDSPYSASSAGSQSPFHLLMIITSYRSVEMFSIIENVKSCMMGRFVASLLFGARILEETEHSGWEQGSFLYVCTPYHLSY